MDTNIQDFTCDEVLKRILTGSLLIVGPRSVVTLVNEDFIFVVCEIGDFGLILKIFKDFEEIVRTSKGGHQNRVV